MELSKRAQSIPASPIRKLIPFANEAKRRGVHVYHLNIGQPDIKTPQQFWHNILDIKSDVLAYGPSNGILPLRKALVDYYAKYHVEVTPQDICITTGGSEALLFALMVTANPGDEILVPEPYYANYNGFANFCNIHVIPITTHAEEGFRLPSRATMESKITSKTKAILFANPGNPTGVVYTQQELEMLADIACDHNLYLIADEVYREFVYEGTFHSILSLTKAAKQAIVTDSISKRYSACGARIGFLVSKNAALMAAVMKYAQARLCPPTLEQFGALGALAVPDQYYQDIISEYLKRRNIVIRGIKNIKGAICHTPQGAFYCIAKLPIDNCEKFAQWMLTDFSYQNQTTMVAPATGFYGTPGMGKDEIRLAYVLNTQALASALEILAKGVSSYTSHLGNNT